MPKLMTAEELLDSFSAVKAAQRSAMAELGEARVAAELAGEDMVGQARRLEMISAEKSGEAADPSFSEKGSTRLKKIKSKAWTRKSQGRGMLAGELTEEKVLQELVVPDFMKTQTTRAGRWRSIRI